MKPTVRMLIAFLAGFAAAGVVVASAIAVEAASRPPVTKLEHRQFRNVLATRGRRALYFWNVEKRANGRVRCTGACARAWPPLIVKSASAVPRRVQGIRGTFGVVKRPDGRLQVTHNRLPIYTYAHENPGQVLCDNVDGWFVVRV